MTRYLPPFRELTEYMGRPMSNEKASATWFRTVGTSLDLIHAQSEIRGGTANTLGLFETTPTWAGLTVATTVSQMAHVQVGTIVHGFAEIQFDAIAATSAGLTLPVAAADSVLPMVAGTAEPEGVITALDGTASEVAPATAEVFAVADVYALLEALPARHRADASWMANLNIIDEVRQFGTADSHAMLTRLGEDTPERLLGKPLFENSAMDGAYDITATADNFLLVIGDWSKFVVVDSGPSELVPYNLVGTPLNLPTAQTGFLHFSRNGAKCTNIDAFRLLNVATTA